jgi:hypothetical protein
MDSVTAPTLGPDIEPSHIFMFGPLKDNLRGHLLNDKAKQNNASTVTADSEQVY